MCVLVTVLHSGEYYLFESDSEDEEESEEQKPQKQTASQVRCKIDLHITIKEKSKYRDTCHYAWKVSAVTL